jgi:hypothetical protein
MVWCANEIAQKSLSDWPTRRLFESQQGQVNLIRASFKAGQRRLPSPELGDVFVARSPHSAIAGQPAVRTGLEVYAAQLQAV